MPVPNPRALGLDLAEHCGYAVVELYVPTAEYRRVAVSGTKRAKSYRPPFEGPVDGRVLSAGTLDLDPAESLYSGKMPRPERLGPWLLQAQRAFARLFQSADVDLIAVEIPDEFMFAARTSRRDGKLHRASSPKTIAALTRLAAMVFYTHAALTESWLIAGPVRAYSPNDWQPALLTGVPVGQGPQWIRDLFAKKETQNKARSLMAAWYDLLFDTEDHNQSDAALLALYALREWQRDGDARKFLQAATPGLACAGGETRAVS